MNKTQAIVFFGIIIVGIITSVFSLTKCEQTRGLVGNSSSKSKSAASTSSATNSSETKNKAGESEQKKMAAAAKKAAAQKTNSKSEPKPEPSPPEKPAGGFTSEKALIDALAKAIKDKKVDLLFELAGPSALNDSARKQLTALLKEGAVKLDFEQPLTAIGRTQKTTRWALRLKTSSDELIEIVTDLTRDPKTGDWKVVKILPPADNKKMTASRPTTEQSPKTGLATESSEQPDALMIAYRFSQAAVNRDIKAARALTDPDRLNGEKLAALLIALEEGKFHLKTDKPLVVTLAREDLTWAITRVESNGSQSEFGVEMNLADDGRWAVTGLTFSKLISMTAAAAGAGDVAYSPIRKNPKGGESLVLYFEFDNEQVSARTRKQLVIVADILKQQEERKIHINGHADAKGEDSYNIALSKRRTAAVKSTLIDLGVNPGQIVTKAFGESMPLKPNFKADGTDNPSGRAQNRRTEIYLDF